MWFSLTHLLKFIYFESSHSFLLIVSCVVPMSESGFRALSSLMFSLFGLQPDPLVLLILGFKMPCTAKVKVGTVPREFILSSLINMSRSNERLRMSESAGIPIQSFVGTGDPSPPQSALPSVSGSLSPLATSGPSVTLLPSRSAGCSLLHQSLPRPPCWSDEDNSPGHRGRSSVWRN